MLCKPPSYIGFSRALANGCLTLPNQGQLVTLVRASSDPQPCGFPHQQQPPLPSLRGSWAFPSERGLVPVRPPSWCHWVQSQPWPGSTSARLEMCVPGRSGADSYQNVCLSPVADFNQHCEEFVSSRGISRAYQQPEDEPAVLKEYKI